MRARTGYGLDEGTGLWIIAAVVSEKPLPPYRKWLNKYFAGKIRWQPVPKLPAGVVWRDDGDSMVDMLTAEGVTPLLRGKGARIEGPVPVIKQLTDSLRAAGRVDAVSALGFGVSAP